MTRLEKRLLNLAIGEFAALCTFIYVFTRLNLGLSSLIAFSFLILILFQGSMYWLYRFTLALRKQSFGVHGIKLLRALKMFNMIILVLVSILIPFTRRSNMDLVFAVVFLFFGTIEYINYYWYRLSYGKSGFNLKVLWNTKLKKSSIHKMTCK